MPVQGDMKYDATVLDVFLTESKEKKTPAIYFLFDTVDGQIDHNMYVTGRTVDRARETMMDCFHVSPEDVGAMAETGDWGKVKGAKLSISTIVEEYDGGSAVRVQWMNPARFKPQKAPAQTAKMVAGLFNGQPFSSPANSPGAPATDWGGTGVIEESDVPF